MRVTSEEEVSSRGEIRSRVARFSPPTQAKKESPCSVRLEVVWHGIHEMLAI